MTMGPLEYVEIGFEGTHFTEEIVPELRALRDRGIIRVVDLVFIQKDQRGNLAVRELADLDANEGAAYTPFTGDLLNLLSADDIEEVALTLPNGGSAAIAILEHLWAIELKETVLKARGRLLDGRMIPAEIVEAVSEQRATDQATQVH